MSSQLWGCSWYVRGSIPSAGVTMWRPLVARGGTSSSDALGATMHSSEHQNVTHSMVTRRAPAQRPQRRTVEAAECDPKRRPFLQAGACWGGRASWAPTADDRRCRRSYRFNLFPCYLSSESNCVHLNKKLNKFYLGILYVYVNVVKRKRSHCWFQSTLDI